MNAQELDAIQKHMARFHCLDIEDFERRFYNNIMLTLEQATALIYTAQRAFQAAYGLKLPAWENLEDADKKEFILCVQKYQLEAGGCIDETLHNHWLEKKLKKGWTYGEKLVEEKKQHPWLLPYASLSPPAQAHYGLFRYLLIAIREHIQSSAVADTEVIS